MGTEVDNQGSIDSNTYKGDPVNTPSPDQTHHEYIKGVTANVLQAQQLLINDVTALEGLAPTQDQKDAMDAASTPTTVNPFATIQDVADQASAVQTAYTFRTATDAPADGETKLNNAVPASATVVNIANFNKNGLNIANLLLSVGLNDSVVISDNNDSTKVYNYDVTGAPTQIGGSGSGGYVAIPVALFSQGTGGLIADNETVNVLVRFDGNNTRFLAKLNDLSDLNNLATSRSNLDVYSKGESDTNDALRLLKTANLSDVASATTSRSNLGLGSAAVKAVGPASGNLQENGGVLGNSQALNTDGTGKIVSETKGTAYNKSFGTASGTVAQGNDSRFPVATTRVVNNFGANNTASQTLVRAINATGIGLGSSFKLDIYVSFNDTGTANSGNMTATFLANTTGSVLMAGDAFRSDGTNTRGDSDNASNTRSNTTFAGLAFDFASGATGSLKYRRVDDDNIEIQMETNFTAVTLINTLDITMDLTFDT